MSNTVQKSFRTCRNPYIDFGNLKMVFECKKKVSELSGNSLRVSDRNKFGNRIRFLRFGNASKRFTHLRELFSVSEFFLSETLRGFPKCSETFFYPWKLFLGIRNRQMDLQMFGKFFGRHTRIPFFLECCRYQLRAVTHHNKAHFIATLIDPYNTLYIYDDRKCVKEVRNSTDIVEYGIYTWVFEFQKLFCYCKLVYFF